MGGGGNIGEDRLGRGWQVSRPPGVPRANFPEGSTESGAGGERCSPKAHPLCLLSNTHLRIRCEGGARKLDLGGERTC